MAETFKWYSDSGMNTVFDGPGGDYLEPDETGTELQFVLYFGSTTAGKQLQAASDPGNDQVTITPTDTTPGSGHEASEIKLATGADATAAIAALSSAVSGAALDMGTTLVSENAYVVAIGLTDSTSGTVSPDTTLSLAVNSCEETAV